MRDVEPSQEDVAPAIALHERALDNLSFIRDTMARSAPLTAVSGGGTVATGLIALAGGYLAALRRSDDWWIYCWLGVACVGCLTSFAALVLKARRRPTPVFWGVVRRFALGLFPPILAGVVLTEIFYEMRLDALMPGTWLLLYGVGAVTGGAFSIRVLPITGAAFMVLGVWAFYPPMALGAVLWGPITLADAFLLGGFGCFHIVCGLVIAWRYNG